MEKREVEKQLLAGMGSLYQFAYRLTRDYDRANDLLQETFLRVLHNAGRLDNDNKFMAWAKTIMHNAFINSCRREELCEATADSSHVNIFTTKDDCASEMEMNEIYCAIDELPGNSGKVMRLLVSGHKSFEIAVRMEIPIGTVKTRINLSRSILKRRLKDYLN